MIRSKILLLFALLVSVPVVKGQSDIDKNTLLQVNQPVPPFKFEISKGKTVSLNDYKGKIALINFFATWCAPCRRELPLIEQQIWGKHKENQKFVMLTFGREHSWEEVLKFGKDQHLSFPVLPDLKRKVYALFASGVIPRSFLIDQSGKIIFMTTGFEESHFNELKDLIDSKLK